MNANAVKKFESIFPKDSINLKSGQILFSPEDSISNIYLLKSGAVRQYVISPTGVEVTIHIFQPVSFFPTMLLFSSAPNRFYFETASPVELKKAPAERVLALVSNNPQIMLDLITRFSVAIDGLSNRLEYLLSEQAENRLSTLLIYLSEKFGDKTKKGITVQLKLTHRDIASWVGLSRETVSRKLSLLKKRNIISSAEGLIIIKDPRALKKKVS